MIMATRRSTRNICSTVLLTMDDSLIAKLINKMDINSQGFVNQAEKLVAKRVKVSGQVQVYMSDALNPRADAGRDRVQADG